MHLDVPKKDMRLLLFLQNAADDAGRRLCNVQDDRVVTVFYQQISYLPHADLLEFCCHYTPIVNDRCYRTEP